MKKALFLLLFFHSLLWGETVLITVKDTQEKPIPFVLIKGEGTTQTTDKNGKAKVFAEDENTVFTLKRLGYKDQQKSFIDMQTNPVITMQKEAVYTEEYTVSARATQPAYRATSASLSIDLVQQEKSYISAEDLLKDFPEISLKGVRLAGEQQTVSLGGHHGRHTIIMLDNIVLNPAGQPVDLSSIPASQLVSIEVVKNNASVDTGSGGIAGMIVLHTKKDTQSKQFNHSVTTGSFGAIKNNMSLDLHKNNIGLNLNISQLHTDNDFKYKYRGESLSRKNNKKDILYVSQDLHYYGDKHHLQYSFHFSEFRKDLPGPVNRLSLYEGAFQSGNSAHNSLHFTFPQVDLQAYHIANISRYENTKAPSQMFYAKEENIHSFKGVKGAWKKDFGVWTLSAGAEIKGEQYQLKDKLNERNSIPETYQTTVSAFTAQKLKYDFGFWDTEIIGSLRTDHSTKFETNTSKRAEWNSTIYTAIPLAIKANYGTSYTIPSFYDIHWKGDSQTSGNPDLLPENSRGWRIECVTESNPAVGAAYWHNRTENLIYWNRSITGWKPFNLAKAEIDNTELNLKYRFLQNQNISVNYTETNARNKTPGANYDKYIVYTPKTYLSAKLDTNIGFLYQTFVYTAQGKQYSTPDQLIPAMRGYELWDTQTRVKFSLSGLEINAVLSVYNWANKLYENYDYVPEPGRHWEGQIGLKKEF